MLHIVLHEPEMPANTGNIGSRVIKVPDLPLKGYTGQFLQVYNSKYGTDHLK